jgi:hypothetical protein
MLYQLHRLMAIALVLVSPVRLAATIPVAIPATAHAQAVHASAPYNLTLDTTKVQPITVYTAPRPNFDTDVLAPLHAAQAAQAQAEAAATAAAAAQAQAAATAAAAAQMAAQAHPVTVSATGDAFTQLRYCEAGGDYTRNSGNGYFGAYQYSIGTWNSYGGFARPDQAPAAVQDAKAHADQATRGWSPWPACSRKLGL